MANKMTIMIILMSGITLFFYFGGLMQNDNPTTTTLLLDMLLHPEKVKLWDFFTTLTAAIEGLAAIGITIALFWAGRADLALMSTPAIFIIDLGLGFLKVFNYIRSLDALPGSGIYSVISIIIFAPLFLIWTMCVLEWWRGITT